MVGASKQRREDQNKCNQDFRKDGKWDVNDTLDMKGTPQRPDPTKLGLHIPVQIRLEPEVPFSMPAMKPARDEEGPRGLYSMKRHFE